jgi:hypothetical protein
MDEARARFALVAERYPKAEIFISAESWTLSEEYERMHYVADITQEYKSSRPLVILLDQNHSYKEWNPGPTPPPEAEGCPLTENYFVNGFPRILGIPLSSVMPGYGFAVYICE